MRITYDGQELDVTELQVTIDKTMEAAGVAFGAIQRSMQRVIEVTQKLTLDFDYYRAIALADMLDAHSPKKAKRIRKMVSHNNPLRIMGLL